MTSNSPNSPQEQQVDDEVPGHRRKARRDERLMSDDEQASRDDSPNDASFDPEQAKRLFSETMRTGRKEIRSLDTDSDQLERLGLPIWKSERELADALDLSRSELYYFASHRKADRHHHYVQFSLPKRSGGRRTIMAPKRQLKAIQRTLLDTLVRQLPISDHAHGFRKGRSIKTNAEPHVGAEIVVRLDLESFFPTVTFPRVRGLLLSYGYGYPVATSLAVLTTAAERQPVEVDDGDVRYVPIDDRYCVQGAPTSPGICNALVRRLDHRLAGLADSMDFTYTRYADDMTFSADEERPVGGLIDVTEEIVDDEGFELNDDKTRVMRSGNRQTVTGVVVNETLGLSRQERRRMRAEIHQIKLAREEGEADPERIERLEGKLAYLEMLNPDQAAPLRQQWEE